MAEPPPSADILVGYFIVSDDVERPARFYTEVLGGREVFSPVPTVVVLANTQIVINTGGGATDEKPAVTLETPSDLKRVSNFLNFRVKDIEAAYALWSARGAVPDSAETATVRDPLLHPRSRLPDRGGADHRPEGGLAACSVDTVIDVGAFQQPGPMRPFAQPGLGELWLAGMAGPAWRWLFRREGVADRSSVSGSEIDAYLTLLKGADGGRAFLKIMRGLELTQAKEDFYYRGLAGGPSYPTQVVWGEGDRMLGANRRLAVQDALGTTACSVLPGRHFLPKSRLRQWPPPSRNWPGNPALR